MRARHAASGLVLAVVLSVVSTSACVAAGVAIGEADSRVSATRDPAGTVGVKAARGATSIPEPGLGQQYVGTWSSVHWSAMLEGYITILAEDGALYVNESSKQHGNKTRLKLEKNGTLTMPGTGFTLRFVSDIDRMLLINKQGGRSAVFKRVESASDRISVDKEIRLSPEEYSVCRVIATRSQARPIGASENGPEGVWSEVLGNPSYLPAYLGKDAFEIQRVGDQFSFSGVKLTRRGDDALEGSDGTGTSLGVRYLADEDVLLIDVRGSGCAHEQQEHIQWLMKIRNEHMKR